MANISQSALAAICGVSQAYLSKIERGDVPPGRALARVIAAQLGVDALALWPELATASEVGP